MATKAKKTRVDVVEVVRHGEALVIPDDLSLEQARDVLDRKIQEANTFTDFTAKIPAFPLDGAYALMKALERKFGVSIASPKMGEFFGFKFVLEAPIQYTVEIDAEGHTVQVPWGEFVVPGMSGNIECGAAMEEGHFIFTLNANVQGKDKAKFEELVALTKEIVATESIYRGKAFRLAFTDENGKTIPMPMPKFMSVKGAARPIFSTIIENQLDYDVLAYITKSDTVRKMRNGQVRRGVLMAGKYGTGKTLTATYIAKLAEENGFTFIYTKADDIPQALDFANTYQPAVIFAEDIEKAAGVVRTEDVGNLLNKLDGIDSKKQDIIFIGTTNNLEQINGAMLRPGRIDVLMTVEPPDAEAAIRIARMYAKGDMLDEGDEDFSAAGALLAGTIPAVIEEAVQRARVRASFRTDGDNSIINNQDLMGAAHSVLRERDALNPRDEQPNPLKTLGEAFGSGVGSTLGAAVGASIREVWNHGVEGSELPALPAPAGSNGTER